MVQYTYGWTRLPQGAIIPPSSWRNWVCTVWQIGDEWSKLISSDHTLNPILFKLGRVRVGSRGGGIFLMRSCSNRPVVWNRIFRVCRNPVIFIFLWPTMKDHQKSSKIWRKELLTFPLKAHFSFRVPVRSITN